MKELLNEVGWFEKLTQAKLDIRSHPQLQKWKSIIDNYSKKQKVSWKDSNVIKMNPLSLHNNRAKRQ